MADTAQPLADVSPHRKIARIADLLLSPMHQHVYNLLAIHDPEHSMPTVTSKKSQDLLRLSANIVTLAKLNSSERMQPEDISVLFMESDEDTEENIALVILHDYAAELPPASANYRVLASSTPADRSAIIPAISATVMVLG
jgi:hypothetical protein